MISLVGVIYGLNLLLFVCSLFLSPVLALIAIFFLLSLGASAHLWPKLILIGMCAQHLLFLYFGIFHENAMQNFLRRAYK